MSDAVSIFNDVLGPVMRGPSSSHTAGSHRIAVLAAALLGTRPASVRVTFDPDGSYARVFRQQGSDRAFAAGFIGWPLTDPRFPSALDGAAGEGIELRFYVGPLADSDHPNEVALELSAPDGSGLALRAAKREPEKHRDLIVRVAGYSDYFCDLTKPLQDEIISRTEHQDFGVS